MSRDDSYLYSGLASPRKVEQEKKKAEERKLDNKAEAVLTEIAKMKADVISVERILLDDSTSEAIKIHRIERMRADYDLLIDLEKRMKTILGVK